MLPVEILYRQGAVVLRARSSELLILPLHVSQLQALKQPKDFSAYFMQEALVNRPARKLFEAWLRKDKGVWLRLFKIIQENAPAEGAAATVPVAPKGASTESAPKAPAKKTTAPASPEASTSKAEVAPAKTKAAPKVAAQAPEAAPAIKTTKAAPASKAAPEKAKAAPASKAAPEKAKAVTKPAKTVAKKAVVKKATTSAAKATSAASKAKTAKKKAAKK